MFEKTLCLFLISIFLSCRCVLDRRKSLTLRRNSRNRERDRERKDEFERGKWRGKGSEEAISSYRKLVSYEWETIQCVWFYTGHSWFLHLSHCMCSNNCFGSSSVWFHCKNLFFLQNQWHKQKGNSQNMILIIFWQAGYTSPTQAAIITDLGLSVSEVCVNGNLRMIKCWVVWSWFLIFVFHNFTLCLSGSFLCLVLCPMLVPWLEQ